MKRLSIKFLLLAVSLALFSFQSLGSPLDLTYEDFQRICRERFKPTLLSPAKTPEPGEIRYLPIAALRAQQSRFSFLRFKQSLKKALGDEGEVVLHDHGNAVYPPSRAIHGILYRGEVLVVDGHHRIQVSLVLGAETIPVEILEDWSNLITPDRVAGEMHRRRLSYFRDAFGAETNPVDICTMADDPNLWLARKLITRMHVHMHDGRLQIVQVSGAKRPIVLKVNQGLPFLEFEIADALRRNGVEVKAAPDKQGALRKRSLKKYIRILADEAEKPHSRLSEILLLKKPKQLRKLNLHQILCEHELTSSLFNDSDHEPRSDE